MIELNNQVKNLKGMKGILGVRKRSFSVFILISTFFFILTTSAVFGAALQNYNLGSSGATNYEVGEAVWNGNVFQLQTRAGGTGTIYPIQITTGPNVGIYMLADGKVGIGTTSPGYDFDVSGSIRGTSLYTDRYIYDSGDTNTYVDWVTTDQVRIVAGGVELWRWVEGGSDYSYTNLPVGIGTTVPAYTLDVAGTAQFTQPVIVGTPVANNQATTKSYVDSMFTGSGPWTLSGSNVYVTNASHNVGIGTASPGSKLQIGSGDLFQVYVDQGSDLTGRWYELGIINDNNGEIIVSGILAGHSDAGGKANVDVKFSVRDGFKALGSVWGLVQDRATIESYDDSVNSRHILYLYTGSYALVNLNLKAVSGAVITYNGTYTTTNPAGTYGTKEFDIRTSAGQLVRTDNAGKVGIGTTTPGNELDIDDGGGVGGSPYIEFNDRVKIGYESSDLSLHAMEKGIRLQNNNGIHLLITSTGSVGIGSTSPGYKLDVAGTGRFTQPVTVGTPTAAGHATTKSYVDSAAGGGHTGSGSSNYIAKWTGSTALGNSSFYDSGGGAIVSSGPLAQRYPYNRFDSWQSDNTGYMWAFGYQKNDGTNQVVHAFFDDGTRGLFSADQLSVVSFTSNEMGGSGLYPSYSTGAQIRASGNSYLNGGNVGIGTTNPAQLLHVAGTARVDSTLYLNNNAHYINAGEFYVNRTTAQGGFTFNNVGVGELIFKTNNSEKMRLDSSGNFGIGSTSPGYKLDVSGTAQFTQPVIVGTPTAGTHAATKSYVDSTVSTVGGRNTYTLSNGDGWYRIISMGGAGVGGKIRISGITGNNRYTDLTFYVSGMGYSQGSSIDVLNNVYYNGNHVSNIRAGTYGTSFVVDVQLNSIDNPTNITIDLEGGLTATTPTFTPAEPTGGVVTVPGNVVGGGSTRRDTYLGIGTTNVGIGTTVPTYKLDVADGGVKINAGTANTASDASLYVTATNNNDWGLVVNKYNGSATEYGLKVEVGSAANYGIRVMGSGNEVFKVSGSGTAYFGGDVTINSNDLYFTNQNPYIETMGQTNSNITFRVQDSGGSNVHPLAILGTNRVSVGTNADLGYTLGVSGTGSFSQPVIVGTPTAGTHAATKSYVDSATTGQTGWTDGGSSVYLTTISDSVGIGTANPDQKLTIAGADSQDAYLTLWADRGDDNNDGFSIRKINGGSIHFQTSKTSGLGGTPGWDPRLIMDTSGNVSIGGSNPTTRLMVEGRLDMTNREITRAIIWPNVYDASSNERSVRNIVLNSDDLLAFAVERGYTVTASRGPDSGSLNQMFRPERGNYASWSNVSPANPVVITLSNLPNLAVHDMLIAPASRNRLPLDYKVETYDIYNGNWVTRKDVTGETAPYLKYIYLGSQEGVQQIRITVTNAGDGDSAGNLSIANIVVTSRYQAGRFTGYGLSAGGDSMWGNLAIQKSSASYALDVTGTGSFSQPVIVGTPTATTHATTKSYVDSMFTGSGQWTTSGSNIYTSLAGNVGIGTNNPSNKLTVGVADSSTTQASGGAVLSIFNSNTTANNYASIAFGQSGAGSNSFSRIGVQYVDRTSGSEDQDIFFSTIGGGAYNERMRILSTGNVGIGTTSPSAKLDVYGGGNNGSGILYVRSSDPGSDGTLIKLSSYSFINQDSSGNSYWSWGHRYDGVNNAWIRTYTGAGLAQIKLGYGSSQGFEVLTDTSTTSEPPVLVSRLMVRNDGNIGIGTASPSYTLDVRGGGTGYFSNPVFVGTPTNSGHAATKSYVDSIVSGGYLPLSGGTLAGNLNMNGNNIIGVNKLTVATIDPLYEIGGEKYSTYASSIAGGVREEYVGRATLIPRKSQAPNSKSQINSKCEKEIGNCDLEIEATEYQYTINFNDVKRGSDLWVWRQTVDFSKENVEIFATPYSIPASIAYEIKGNRIFFNSEILNTKYSIPDTGLEFSYRLVGKRIDWKSWPTYAKDQSEKASIVIE